MSLRFAFAWSLSGQMASFAATFGATVLLTRLLTPREIGIYAAGLAVVGVLQAISAFGVGSYVIRENDITRATLSTAFTVNAGLCAVLAAIVFLASLSDWVTAGEPQVRTVLYMLSVVPLLNAFELRPASMLQREMDFRSISLVTTARALVGAVCSVVAAWYGAGALSAAYGAIAQALVGVVGFSVLGWRHVGLSMSMAGWRSMVGFGFQTLAISGVSTASARASDFILGRILGFASLGVYSRASALSNTIFQNLYGSLARVLFSRLAEDHRESKGTATSYLRGLDIILALLWPMLIGLAVLSGPAIQTLFGPRWIAAAQPLTILLIAQAFCLAFAMNHELFILRDRLVQQTRREIARSVVGLIAFAIGCAFGLVGAALARIVDALIGVALYVPLLPDLAGVRFREVMIVYLRNAALSAAATGPAMLVMAYHGWDPATPLLAVGVAGVAGAMLWVILLGVLRNPLYGELVRIVMLARGRKGPSSST